VTSTPMTAIDCVRKRPGMYVGDTDGSGAMHLVLEVVANAFDQYLVGRCSRIDVEIAADRTVTVTDDGPGMPVDGDATRPPLEHVLTTLSHRPTVDGHKPHVHLWVGGVGLFAVNALSERFEMITARDGVEARIVYTRGVLLEQLTRRPSTRTGTRVRFRPDPEIFANACVPRVALTRHLEDLSFLAPGLALTWTLAGDAQAAHGLAGRVAIGAHCAVADVAQHRGTYETPGGPVDVEVALAWRTVPGYDEGKARIDSFVNLQRSREGGTHVDGMLDGIARAHGEVERRGLVAAVSVVLADVKFGNPSRDRLVTPEVREIVAQATAAALSGAT
jgi:DNA gyrase subunit B